MVLHELWLLPVVSGVRVGPWSVFGGAMKGRQAGSGSPSWAGGEGKCLFWHYLQQKNPAHLLGTRVSASRTLLEVVSKGTRPDVSFRKPLSHVPRWGWWWSAAPAQVLPVPYALVLNPTRS